MANKRLVFTMILAGSVAALVGCELAVDFDRSKIPADSTDSGDTDATGTGTGDASLEASADSSTADASSVDSFYRRRLGLEHDGRRLRCCRRRDRRS